MDIYMDPCFLAEGICYQRCKNGGQCQKADNEIGYECSCMPPWTGINCEIGTV